MNSSVLWEFRKVLIKERLASSRCKFKGKIFSDKKESTRSDISVSWKINSKFTWPSLTSTFVATCFFFSVIRLLRIRSCNRLAVQWTSCRNGWILCFIFTWWIWSSITCFRESSQPSYLGWKRITSLSSDNLLKRTSPFSCGSFARTSL